MEQMTLCRTEIIEPQKLLDAVMFARVDYTLLVGAEVESMAAALLEQALPLIAQAWELPQETLTTAQDIVQQEHAAALHDAQTGEHTPCRLPPDKVLESMRGEQIIDVIWSLFETAVRTSDAEQRAHLLKTARFLSEYWNLDEWIAE